MKGGEIVGLFTKKTTTNSVRDPMLDALVSLSSDDPNVFVGSNALKNSDIYAAISLIAGDLASNPIKCDKDIYNKMVNDLPNNYMDGYHFKYAIAVEMLLNGNSYAEIRPNHQLHFIPSQNIVVQQDEITGRMQYIYSPNGKIKRNIDNSKILHFKCFSRDGVTGISPLFALDPERKIQKAGNDLLVSFLKNGVHGTTVVKAQQSELKPKAAENIRKKFDQVNQGNNTMKTVVIDDSMDVSSLPLNTDVLKLTTSNDWSTRQIAKVFGLPVEKLGLENEHSNQQQSNLQYLQGTLQHYEDFITSELNYKLGQHFEYDNSKLLSLDPAAQQAQAVEGYTNGLYTQNEARQILNLPPVNGGDQFMNGGNSEHGEAITD